MSDKQKFEKSLTWEEIEVEIDRVKDFFELVPDDLKAWAAERFIYEIVNWASSSLYEALGIFQEAMNRYREVSLRVLEEEMNEEDEVRNASENAQDYRCIEKANWADPPILVDEICKIGLVCEDDRYSGGKRYEVFLDSGKHFDICQHSFENYFELVD